MTDKETIFIYISQSKVSKCSCTKLEMGQYSTEMLPPRGHPEPETSILHKKKKKKKKKLEKVITPIIFGGFNLIFNLTYIL